MVADTFRIESSAFQYGDIIPEQYTAHGDDISPPVRWGNIPRGAEELVLICEDPDAPKNPPFIHWIVYNILPSDVKELPAGVPPRHSTYQILQGKNSYGQFGYKGPNPPAQTGSHRYFFRLFALDQKLNLSQGATGDEIMAAMEDHVLAEAQWMGTHQYH